jgi:hypothetical protein
MGGTAVRFVTLGQDIAAPGSLGRHPVVLKMMLALGVLAPIYYIVVNDVVAALRYPGYDRIARPVSELSATYAPTRPVLVPLLVIFDLLIIPFWIGVWRAARANRALRLTSGLMLGFRALALLAFPFPMVADEILGVNTMHTIIWGVLTPVLLLAGIGASAAAFGKTFRVYAILTLMALVAFSVLAGVQAAQVTAGEPVRWFGVTERGLIGVWLQWVAVLAISLLREGPVAPRHPAEPPAKPILTPQKAAPYVAAPRSFPRTENTRMAITAFIKGQGCRPISPSPSPCPGAASSWWAVMVSSRPPTGNRIRSSWSRSWRCSLAPQSPAS